MVKSKRKPQRREVKLENRQRKEQEIESLKTRVVQEAPARGYAPPLSQIVAFPALSLSQATQQGLLEAKFTSMTAIQNACIPHALAGRDILGAAKTGSGKTLAFLIPILEDLYRNQFTPNDGPGAIVLSPTRELAIQIFQVLKRVGKQHVLSAGLLIGGKKDFYIEQEQISTTNIIIATPGRLLQHFEQTPYLELSELRLLVLDEADRILDMGFRDQLVRILEYLPNERQTMLFSATQTKDVSSLAKLSLNQPEYLGVHDKSATTTPESLDQSYVVVPLEHKLNAIYSFIKSHLKSKSIIFMATCAQIRYAHDLFCSLRPGISVLGLHGKLAQERRTQIYFDYLNRPHAVLFATDIAARGLDFPNVDWVVQADAPEDRNMYIHRAGRTARYRSGGKSLLILTESEEKNGFVNILQGKNCIPLKKLSINPNKATVVTERASSLVASNVHLNTLAKKAFQSYVRSIHLMPHKDIFDVKDIDLDGFSKALGLASTPNLQFLKQAAKDRSEFREKKNVNKKLQRLKEQIKAEKLARKMKKLGRSGNATSTQKPSTESSDSDDEILVSKKGEPNMDEEDVLPDANLHEVSRSRHPKKIRVDGSHGQNQRIVFDDEGRALGSFLKSQNGDIDTKDLRGDKSKIEMESSAYLDKVRARLDSTREQDHADQKERIRQKHKKRRLEEKGEKSNSDDTGGVKVVLGIEEPELGMSTNSSSSSSASSSDDSSSSSDSSSSESDTNLKEQEEMALRLIRGT